MKKLLFCLCVSAFTLATVRADEPKACEQSKAACADKAQAACGDKAQGATCTAKAGAEAKSCCDAKKSVRVLHSPRGALMAKR